MAKACRERRFNNPGGKKQMLIGITLLLLGVALVVSPTPTKRDYLQGVLNIDVIGGIFVGSGMVTILTNL